MKGRIISLGFAANIEQFKMKDQIFYRLRIGPSFDVNKLKQIKSELREQNIKTYIQKVGS